MAEFDFLVPCPGCNKRISEKSRTCPHCGIELVQAEGGIGFKPKHKICPSCGKKTAPDRFCVHCGASLEEIPENIPDKPPVPPKSYMPKAKPRSWDHIPNPLAYFMDDHRMARWGFNYELRWTYLIIGVACFFLYRLFFVFLFSQYGTLLNPFNIISDVIHGVLVGGLVGMRGSGAGNGAKFGALVSFAITFVLLTPVVIFAILGITSLMPEFFKSGGKTIFISWFGLSALSSISGAIVGAFIGFYIDHARG